MSKPIDYSIKIFDLLKKMEIERKVYPEILISITKDKLSKPITRMLLKHIRTMRRMTEEYDLLPSIQEEIDKLDKDNVNRLSKAFSNKLAGILVENEGNA